MATFFLDRQVEILQELLEEASCNVNTYNYNGQAPIHTAASLNTHPQVIYFRRIGIMITMSLRTSPFSTVTMFCFRFYGHYWRHANMHTKMKILMY